MSAKDNNYVALIEAIKKEIDWVKNELFSIEDPKDGNMIDVKISDISIHILRFENNAWGYSEGEFNNVLHKDISDCMIRVYIEKNEKISRSSFCFTGLSITPDGFRIFFRKQIFSVVKSAFESFYEIKKIDSKYSKIATQKADVYVQDISKLIELNGNVSNRVKSISRNIYNIDNVLSVAVNVGVNRRINIVVDGFGREILESRDIFNVSFSVIFLTKTNFSISENFVRYAICEEDLFKYFDEAYEFFIKTTKKYDVYSEIESGHYPVLFDSSATHTFFHEAIAAHLLSGKYIVNGGSTIFKRKNKDLVVDEKYNILRELIIEDRPNDAGKVASYLYDQEGIKSSDIVLVDKGVLKNYLTDLNSAFRLEQESNGHSLSECYIGSDESGKSIAVTPEPRISNLVVRSINGVNDSDMESSIKNFCLTNGFKFYLKIKSYTGEVDPSSGLFSMICDSVDKINIDGTIEHIISGKLSGQLFDFISSILLVGKDLHEDKGVCGAESGYVPTHGETPDMFLYGISFIPNKKPEETTDCDLKYKYIPKE